MKLTAKNIDYPLISIDLTFYPETYENVFGKLKNGKSLAQTVQSKRYLKFKNEVNERYSEYLDLPIGEFLMMLKSEGDDYYKVFLNPHGDEIFSKFELSNSEQFDVKGVYAYFVNGQLRYIGRCKDSMKKRINSGYGKISPKNCYLDGQSTNCHLNSLITAEKGEVTLWLHSLECDNTIEALEAELIAELKPSWNA